MNRLCVVCARKGSKGIYKKNIRPVAGKPLIQHTLEQAQGSMAFDAIAVSSDSKEILETARRLNVIHLVKRPQEFAADETPKIPAIRHCTASVEEELGIQFDVIVDLDVTSPLRNIDDIHGAINLLEISGAPNVVSGMPSRRSPYFNLVELNQNGQVRLSKPLNKLISRRQDSPRTYDLNASVFVWTRHCLFSMGDSVYQENTLLFEMPEERSIDIDNEIDLMFVEFILKKRVQG